MRGQRGQINPLACAIVQQSGHCLHLTPYRAPQNSAAMRLELPAWGSAGEDPRQGVHVSTVHPFQRAALAHQWGSNYPCLMVSGGTRRTRKRGPRGKGEPRTRSTARAVLLPLAPDAVSRACTARGQPLPAPSRAPDTACRQAQHSKPRALGLPFIGPDQRWREGCSSTVQGRCLANGS